MPSKTEEYLALAQRTANGLTRYWESWTDYLTTASRLYKYTFADQLMIYAQRPDATACADFDIWNNRMNRYVRRGAKGIALLDESGGFTRLHYVFDVSDTGVRRNSRDPEVWQFNDDLKQPVSEMLSKTYGISGERVSQQLADVAGKLVADYWDNNGGDILQENKIGSIEEMQERVNAATARYHELGDSIKAAEQRMAEIAVLRAHIVNYAKNRPVYDAYRKAGYSKKFLEEHREQITLHKAAKVAFDEASLKKLPKVKELDAEYSALLSQKKAAYPAYRKARDEMQELKKAQKNVELFFAEEKDPKEKSQTR